MSARLRPFHLAFPVDDLDAARGFYADLLGCRIGRSSARWVDFDFFGHQITAHLASTSEHVPDNEVDARRVPVRHFGIILGMDDWKGLAERLGLAGVDFLIEPTIRFAGQPAEQATLFVVDPSGNALEFKAFEDDASIFAST